MYPGLVSRGARRDLGMDGLGRESIRLGSRTVLGREGGGGGELGVWRVGGGVEEERGH